MRKGQIKILEQAHKWGYPEIVIEQLSREDLTLRELNRILSDFWVCKEHDNEWAKAYMNSSNDDIKKIIRYCDFHNITLSASDLKSMSTIDAVCRFFSQGEAICFTLSDVKIILKLRELNCKDKYFQTLLNFSRRYREYLKRINSLLQNEIIQYPIYDAIEYLSKYADSIYDFETFVDEINVEDLFSENEKENRNTSIINLIKKHLKKKYNFTLKAASGIPAEIKKIDFRGYKGQIDAEGYSRYVSDDKLTCYSFTYTPFYRVEISSFGKFYTKSNSDKEKTILMFYDDDSFVTKYHVKGKERFRPTQVRELFDSISIFDDENDKENAWAFVTSLCDIFGTYIFRDLYKDYLASGGLLLPCLMKEVVQYQNKRDLMLDLYHCEDLNVNLNKRNCNSVYALSKIYKRMTNEAFAKALQVDDIKFQHIGRKRYKFALLFYNALYGTSVSDDNDILLRDSIYEEYKNKAISLLSPRTTVEHHNRRAKEAKVKKLKFSIKKGTKFKTLIDNMPAEYELIRTPERLIAETYMQHNCVALSDNYSNRIKEDKSLLYSSNFENYRHTIEIVGDKGNYRVAQCYKACNKSPSAQFLAKLKKDLQEINEIKD